MKTSENLRTLLHVFPDSFEFIPEVIPPRDMNTRGETTVQVDEQDSRCHGENDRVSVRRKDVPSGVDGREKPADEEETPKWVAEDKGGSDDNERDKSVRLTVHCFSSPFDR